MALFDVNTRLARAFYFLADAHIRFEPGDDDDVRDDRMKETYNKGLTAAERALVLYSPKFAQAIKEKKPFNEAAKSLDKGAIPAVYWYATNAGKWALLEGFTEILSRKDDIKAMMDRAAELDPNYFYGGPHRYFGAYFTKLPFPGGDLKQSKAHFDKAVSMAPNYLGTRVLIAEMHATKAENKAMFKEQLEFVLKFDVESAPELKAENTFEQRKAKALMANIDDLF